MKIKYLILLLLMGSVITGMAAPIDRDTAYRAAQQWLQQSSVLQYHRALHPNGGDYAIEAVYPLYLLNQAEPSAYHVELAPHGFLIMNADDRLAPVISFSYTSDYMGNEMPANTLRARLVADLTDGYYLLNTTTRQQDTQDAIRGYQALWDRLLEPSAILDSFSPGEVVTPPLLSSAWGQSRHFNNLLPAWTNSPPAYNEHVPAGCVNTAGAQFMRHYRWPPYGRGSVCYTDSVGFSRGTYGGPLTNQLDWNNMHDQYDPYTTYSTASVHAVSTLYRDLAYANQTDFETNGSACSTRGMGDVLCNHYFYTRPNYSLRSTNSPTFDQRLEGAMTNGHPTLMTMPNHSFIADGFARDGGTNYFHCNYGWNGQNDGWYQSSHLVDSNAAESALFDCQPNRFLLRTNVLHQPNTSGFYAVHWGWATNQPPPAPLWNIREGRFPPAFTNVWDPCTNTWPRWDNGGTWQVTAGGHEGTAGFYHPGRLGTYPLTALEPIRPGTSSWLRYNTRTALSNDEFRVRCSTNRGTSWMVLTNHTHTGYQTGWKTNTCDLSGFAGRDTYLSFEYSFTGGSYYGEAGAVWLDNIAISNARQLSWSPLTNTLTTPPLATLTQRIDNSYYYRAFSTNVTPYYQSPSTRVNVQLDPFGDIDHDNMPNYWESNYFGNATNAMPGVDNDGDDFSNWAEYWSGSIPTNPNSYFRASINDLNGPPTLTWPSVSGRTYTVRGKTNLMDTHMRVYETNIPARPSYNEYALTNDPVDRPAAFLEVVVEGPP